MAARSSPLTTPQALFFGTLAVAGLDILDAVLFFGIRNDVQPIAIFQSIASGVMGRAAYDGGVATALLGGALHVLIALLVVAVYLAAARRWRRLARKPLLYGPLYGLAVYVVMNLVVVPLSAAAVGPPSWPVVVNGVLIHILGVGVPTAYVAKAGRR